MHPITQLECIQFIVDFDLHISSIEIFLNHLKALQMHGVLTVVIVSYLHFSFKSI